MGEMVGPSDGFIVGENEGCAVGERVGHGGHPLQTAKLHFNSQDCPLEKQNDSQSHSKTWS